MCVVNLIKLHAYIWCVDLNSELIIFSKRKKKSELIPMAPSGAYSVNHSLPRHAAALVDRNEVPCSDMDLFLKRRCGDAVLVHPFLKEK